MFLFDWFYGILGWRQKEANIMFLGLDNACKMMLLHRLKGERLVANQRFFQYPPMQYSTLEELSIGNIKFKVFDLGGHQIARRVWRDYNAKVDAVVYVVKARDFGRLAESKRELEALLSDESLANVPFLILADASFYRDSEELLKSRLGLTNFTTGKGKVNLGDTNVRPLEVFLYNFLQGRSQYIDGFEWLSQYIM